MRRSSSAIHLAADAVAMSSRPPFRSSSRRFCEVQYDRGGGYRLVTGESHIQSVQDANHRFRHADRRDGFSDRNDWPRPSQRFIDRPNRRHPLPSSDRKAPQHHFHQTIRHPHQFRSRLPRPSDYREWEFAKAGSPPASERFVVLSYNILADYLAIDHRSKLYFHIPEYMLDWRWRKKSIIFELGLWSADIMCLQEVDRFQDLEEELKPRGYAGVWKMRTGNATDGCAIFWRKARFKLVHEESVEFNKLGLRDNVAQICVLELLKLKARENTDPTSTSPSGSHHVIICNIHVLYNPKRGDIKLGQVRTLLERASAVSKIWDNAPIVLCGDFNCTPKSPLYNFIVEQKLDLSGVDRDKVSGQASGKISSPRIHRADNIVNVPSSTSSRQMDVELGTGTSTSKTLHILNENPSQNFNSLSGEVACWSGGQDKDSPGSNKVALAERSILMDPPQMEGNHSNPSTLPCALHDSSSNGVLCKANLSEVKSLLECSENHAVSTVAHDEECHLSNEKNAWNLSADVSCTLEEKLDAMTLTGREGAPEDSESFSEAVHDHDLNQSVSSDQNSSSQGDRLANDNLSDTEPEAVLVERSAYDSALWTPMEIATATGIPDCNFVEHQIKLTSTYTEVEDQSKTRDSSGEPLVTSYNRCFKGTVDYIWRSEGLQTVRVLAPMPIPAMEWTSGFPTKKWGSDHIALASELTFDV